MSAYARKWLAMVAVAGLLAGGLWLARAPGAGAVIGGLEARDGLRWHRGNLHTHSYWSDGNDFLEMIATWYRDRKYDFLVFTDHNTMANKERWVNLAKIKEGEAAYKKLQERFPEGWIDEREVDGRHEVRLKTFDEVVAKVGDANFLMIQGEEISDKFAGKPLHLCAANLKEMLPPMGGDSVADVLQKNVEAVIAQRERTGQKMMIHVNHPNFGWAVTAEDLMQIRGERFFEVYNGHPHVHNHGDHTHAGTERVWDIILTRRITELDLPLMYGLAVDDGHDYHHLPSRASEPGRGWVMVLADALQPDALIDALEAGRFYSSSGVNLKKIEWLENGLAIEIQEEEGVTWTTEFIGTSKDFDPTSEPVLDADGKELPVTRRYSNDVGRVLATVTGPNPRYTFQGDELYVRAKITSSKQHPNPSEIGDAECAWIQPVYGPAAKK